MSCCCNKPIPTVNINSVVNAVGVTVLVCNPFSGAIGNCGRFNICNRLCLPNSAAGNIVVLYDGVTAYVVETCNGNYLRVTQILGRCCCDCQKKFLHMRLLGDPVHVQCIDCLPEGCSPFLTPILNIGIAAQLPSTVVTALEKSGAVVFVDPSNEDSHCSGNGNGGGKDKDKDKDKDKGKDNSVAAITIGGAK